MNKMQMMILEMTETLIDLPEEKYRACKEEMYDNCKHRRVLDFLDEMIRVVEDKRR
jgi:hypothetical protein